MTEALSPETLERLRVLEKLVEAASATISGLAKLVQKTYPQPKTDEYKFAEQSTWAIINLRAALRDLLDESVATSVTNDESYMGREERVEQHESFGVIQANCVSGHRRLFGSVLDSHQHYIEITLTRGEARFPTLDERMIAWPKNGYDGHVASVMLSAAQWAEMVTCTNIGMGIPCTLSRVRGRRMEDVPDTHENRVDRVLEDFRREMKKAPRETKEAEAKLIKAIEEMKISEKQKGTLIALVRPIAPAFEVNVPYVLERFNEAAETSLAAVKSEVDATLSLVAMKLGLAEMRKRQELPTGDDVPPARIGVVTDEEGGKS